MNAGLLYSKIQ